MTEEEWDKVLEERSNERIRGQTRERIRKEGFETTAWDPEPGEYCIRQRSKQLSPRRRVIAPCGSPAIIGLHLRTPNEPDGIHIPLCRACLVAELKNLMSYLD
jgi:hypothetical protein